MKEHRCVPIKLYLQKPDFRHCRSGVAGGLSHIYREEQWAGVGRAVIYRVDTTRQALLLYLGFHLVLTKVTM